jgi:hypothetical protein
MKTGTVSHRNRNTGDMKTHRAFKLLLVITLLLASCKSDLLTRSAQELTGGNGAGMSGSQP